MTKRLKSDRGGTPSFVQPFLHALNSMQERESLRPDQFVDRVKALLVERLGEADAGIEASFSHGCIGVQADHTNYFDGFALMMTLRRGMAVAVRGRSDHSFRLVIEGVASVAEFEVTTAEDDSSSDLVTLIRSVLVQIRGDETAGLDIAVLGSLPSDLLAPYISSVTTALTGAVSALDASSQNPSSTLQSEMRGIEEYLGVPFSKAYVIGSKQTRTHDFIVVDTATEEDLGLGLPDAEGIGSILVNTAPGLRDWPVEERWSRTQEALERLRRRGFPELDSFRDLEHKDLESALGASNRKARSTVRFLVTENQRVQKLVGAVRRKDWQFFGALLMMSYSCRREDWDTTTSALDFIVKESERFSMDGVYGATQTGEGSYALVVGQSIFAASFYRAIEIFMVRPY